MSEIVTADWHIETDNHDLISRLTDQLISEAKSRKIDSVFILGDVFESRKAQPLTNLSFFSEILEKFSRNGITVVAIPGNHDKVDQQSTFSYLSQFKFHPDFVLIEEYEFIDRDNGRYHFIPYFKEDTTYLSYIPKISLSNKKPNVLFTHVAITGVKNNDGEVVQNSIKHGMLKGFHSVFVGHYHNKSKIYDNTYYIGSLYPRDFGEDQSKGFIVLNDDLSFDEFLLDFPKFLKVKIDVEKVSLKEIDRLISQYKGTQDHVRFSFYGPASKLKALDASKFEEVGIDVEFKQDDVEKAIRDVESGEIVYFDKKEIYKEFDIFCEKEELSSRHIGLKYLRQILKDE